MSKTRLGTDMNQDSPPAIRRTAIDSQMYGAMDLKMFILQLGTTLRLRNPESAVKSRFPTLLRYKMK